MLAGNNTPYAYRKRSGPGLEKDTLLGLCLKISTPKNNPAFPSANAFRQSPDSVEKATDNQRRQLRVYQETLNKLIMALIKGGLLHPLLLVALAVLLRSKAQREEQALLRNYPDYAAYQQRVPAFFPGF